MSVAFDDDGRTRIMQLLLMGGLGLGFMSLFCLVGCGCEERDIHRERERGKKRRRHILPN